MELSTVWTGGHNATVLCLGVDAEGRVASGGEGGELRLWSPDGRIAARRTFPSGADVNSVCFSPRQPSVLYVSAGEAVALVDSRCPEPAGPGTPLAVHGDDVNQLAADPRGAVLASCDDEGLIKLLDLRAGRRKVLRTLRAHGAICSSVRFHPTVPREMASGGLDCLARVWETTRAGPRASVDMREVAAAAADRGAPSSYLINPPLVHSVDYSRGSGGELLACGLENARVQLLRRSGRRDWEAGPSLEAHTGGVTQVSFAPDRPGQTRDALLTAGNDCQLMLWDPAGPPTPGDGLQPENSDIESLPSEGARPTGRAGTEVLDRGDKGSCSAAAAAAAAAGAAAAAKTEPRLHVKHKDKINWIAPHCSSGGVNLVFVADVSEVISVYRWTVD